MRLALPVRHGWSELLVRVGLLFQAGTPTVIMHIAIQEQFDGKVV
jgi:hypothetical protein